MAQAQPKNLTEDRPALANRSLPTRSYVHYAIRLSLSKKVVFYQIESELE